MDSYLYRVRLGMDVCETNSPRMVAEVAYALVRDGHEVYVDVMHDDGTVWQTRLYTIVPGTATDIADRGVVESSIVVPGGGRFVDIVVG